jgi:hypothetical protein
MKTKDQKKPTSSAPAEDETDGGRFIDFARKIVAVPKKEIDEKQAEWEREQAKKKATKKP